jgi:imidazolonepropionase-like amidohydrolase
MRGYRAPRAFDGEAMLPDGALVLVDDGRIVGVEAASFPAPTGCRVTDFADATLLPGLIDAHVHLCADSSPRALDIIPERTADEVAATISASLQQHLRAGVTAVRDLGDHQWAVVDRTHAADEPTIVAAGPPITMPHGHCWSMGGETSGLDDLRQAVRERAERGADVVKVMASGGVLTFDTDVFACQFTLDELRAAVDEAHRYGLPVTAHAHGLSAVQRSLDAGVDGIEHCSCLTPDGVVLPPELARELAESGIAVCPTVGQLPDMPPPPHVQARLDAVGASPEIQLVNVAGMQRAGVRLIAGTDAGIGPSKRHGVLPYGVADLVDCGMSASEALTAATTDAARACGLEGRTGRLAAGLDADLLVVGGDPTADIAALLDVRLVVRRGREVVSAGQ